MDKDIMLEQIIDILLLSVIVLCVLTLLCTCFGQCLELIG